MGNIYNYQDEKVKCYELGIEARDFYLTRAEIDIVFVLKAIMI